MAAPTSPPRRPLSREALRELMTKSLDELKADPTILKVSRGLAPARDLDSRDDIKYGVESVDEALRALSEWKDRPETSRFKVTK